MLVMGRSKSRRQRSAARGARVDDVHARLSPTRVARIEAPRSIAELRELVRTCALRGEAIALAGGRHSMGGQPFRSGAVLVDTRALRGVRRFDREQGLLEVGAGVQWPELARICRELPSGARGPLTFRQKQTGADSMTLGGSVSSNVHGRGLRLPPFASEVEEILLVDAEGELRRASRECEAELFALAVGGYGLFGAIASVTLRLVPRVRLRRRVELRTTDGLMDAFAARRDAGFRYGDFQFAIDGESDDFLRTGVFSCYEPVECAAPSAPRQLALAEWRELVRLAHVQKREAFRRYASHYLATDGQVYDADLAQLSPYLEGYHEALDPSLPPQSRGRELIGELFVPRGALETFLADARELLRAERADLIYGTIRAIERDDASFLGWAREPWACVVLNLHVGWSADELERAARAFRGLIELALTRRGSYYLTYHRFATARQALVAHPRLRDFLLRKLEHDPDERFQSDWYRHLRALVGLD